MKIDVKIPSVGESISEATIGQWTKKHGEMVKRNDVILLLETDKASVELVAEQDGVLSIAAEQGKVVPIGSVVGSIDSDGKASVSSAASASPAADKAPAGPSSVAPAGSPQRPATANGSNNSAGLPLSPAVQRVVTEAGLDPKNIPGTGKDGRITKGDALQAASAASPSSPNLQMVPSPATVTAAPMTSISAAARIGQPTQKRTPMTTIRKRIAERLVYSQQSTATLTTFNEVDMTRVNDLRAKYKEKFKEKYGVGLGVMGLFTKASVEALKALPNVNAFIEGTDIVYNNYYNVGVAVSTEKGLIVPVVRNADGLSIAEIEMVIREYALKARDGKISVDDLSGGTFTISNGGVFGSLMSTPILNPPQSAILGMHKVEDRPVVVNGQIVIRPMMYVALSYDHRLIDGKEAVSFLVKVKEGIEDPERLLLSI